MLVQRYILPAMQDLWIRPESKFEYWLRVELAVLRAESMTSTSSLTVEECDQIQKHARFTVERIHELEELYQHDMIAFVECVRESLIASGLPQRQADAFHRIVTSYDIEDPALILMLNSAVMLLELACRDLEAALLAQAREHQWTTMIGRTHGQWAEPTTFGQLLLVYREAIRRSRRRLLRLHSSELSEGKISGAIGTHAGIDPHIEASALELLDLKPARAETQILQRDRHAAVLSAGAIAAGSLEQMARTFWLMMRSDVGELEESRSAKQRGSSHMPQKKNPILTERLIGLARLVRADALNAMENIATPEWRAIEQSSVERHIFPRATGLVHYMLVKMTGIVGQLVIHPERMKDNLEASYGTWAAHRVRNLLIAHGVPSPAAYELVQQASFAAVESRQQLRYIIRGERISKEDPRLVRDVLPRLELDACFDAEAYIHDGIEHIFKRCLEP